MPVRTPSPTPGDATFEPAQLYLNERVRVIMRLNFLTLLVGASSLLIGCGQAANTNTGEGNSAIAISSAQTPDPNKNANAVSTAPSAAPNANLAGPSPAAGNSRPSAQVTRKVAPANSNIPDAETLKRQTQKTENSNAEPPPPGAGDGMMMKSRKKPANVNNK